MQLDHAPLPKYRNAREILRHAATALAPAEKVSVSECASRHRRLHNPGVYVGPWDNTLAPWLVEPMDMFSRSDVREVHLMGPSQISGKSEMLLNVCGHAIIIDPSDIIYMMPSVELARDLGDRRFTNKFLGQSPDYGALLNQTRDGNKTFNKTFTTGAQLTIVWPSPAQVSARTARIVLVDERDRMPDNLGGEGDPVTLIRNRNRMYGRRRKLGNASSPSKEDGSGIAANVAEGDRRIRFVDCLHCAQAFSPGFDAEREPTDEHLCFDAGSKDAAMRTAGLKCPGCGAVHESHDRVIMNRTGRWTPEGGDPALAFHPPPPNGIVSYWLHGLVSTFAELGEFASNRFEADRHFERTGEETKLRTHFNTDFGIPYKSKLDQQAPLREDEITARQGGYAMGIAPQDVRFLTAAVDVQKNRFEVMVKGWDADYQSWLIDRFRIAEIDGQPMDPAGHPEHWLDLIERVLRLVYDVAPGPAGETLPIACTAIDTGGLEGVIDNARAFWRHAMRKGFGDGQVRLIKGSSSAAAPDLPTKPTPERDGSGKPIPDGAPLYILGVHGMKDTVVNRYRRQEAGPSAMHLPHDLPDYVPAELTAERRHKGVWVKEGPNETFDLEVYNLAAAKMVRPERINWQNPPWFAQRKPAKKSAKTAPTRRRRGTWAKGY